MPQSRPELIAEIGSVHDGSEGNALRLIDLAKEVGADTVKFQMHIASAETIRAAPSPAFFQSENRYEYFARTEFRESQWNRLKRHADDIGIGFLVSPFSVEAAKRLISMGITRIKVASGEIDNRPLLDFLVDANCSLLISTGMSYEDEISRVLDLVAELEDVTLMQCTSIYPCPVDLSGAAEIPQLIRKFGRTVGFSDHTSSNTAAIVAASLGAVAIEKHLTFSQRMYGSDAPYACEPSQFSSLARALSEVSLIVNSGVSKDDTVTNLLQDTRRVFRHGIFAACELASGSVITPEVITSKKPATGIDAWRVNEITGRKVRRDIHIDEPLMWEDLV